MLALRQRFVKFAMMTDKFAGVFFIASPILGGLARTPIAFFGLIGGMTVVTIVAFHPATKGISFLWHNPIGAVAVLVVGLTVSALDPKRAKTAV